jgi:hypothetical protein
VASFRAGIRRALRSIHHAIVYESSAGAASEIAAWANVVPAVAAGAGAWLASSSSAVALGCALVVYVALRLALANRVTVWIAATLGTLGVAAAGGALAWLFAHAVEHPSAPPIAAVAGALASAAAPAWAYAQIARRRLDDVPDSGFLRAPSMPPSG